jgi:pimeloyl-ACP methyl ester carboxylesterase
VKRISHNPLTRFGSAIGIALRGITYQAGVRHMHASANLTDEIDTAIDAPSTTRGRAQFAVRPFRIDVDQGVLDDLQVRLESTRWNAIIPDSDWKLGTSSAYLRDLVTHWQHSYDWRVQEATLNALPQFRTVLDDVDMHFIHMRGRGPEPMPLLLLHGWPDSFNRFYKVIPTLIDPAQNDGVMADSFDLVIPSLPGFGFTGRTSGAPTSQPSRQSARLLWRLMTEALGYERFAVAGGDTGSAIAQILAIDFPDSVIAIHLTDLGWHASNIDLATATHEEKKYLEHSKKRFLADSAYVMVQTTRPHSLAAGLNDSPVGLASWIVDRFHSWSDHGSEVGNSFSKDEMLTNIMIYWITQTIGSSMFTYYAEANSPSLTSKDHVDTPVGVALFPKDIGGIPPRSLAERTLNVRRWTEMAKGSHFAALEQPRLYTDDLVEFFRPFRNVSH